MISTVSAYEYDKLVKKQFMTYMTDLTKMQLEFLIGKLGGSLETKIPRFADIFEAGKEEPEEDEADPEEIIGNIRTKIGLINRKGENP